MECIERSKGNLLFLLVTVSWHLSGRRMADKWIMGHIKWLFALTICFSGKNAFCEISLNMEDSVIGVRGFFVKIPCTYNPFKGYEEVKVEWSLPSQVIIHRMESQDHIPLVNFRERVKISNSPGDVSLTIMKLSMSDRGNIKCKVTWKKNDGTLTFKEDVTVLKVLRANSGSSGNFITTGEPDYKTIKPATETPKENTITTTHEELETMTSTTQNPKENIITITYEELETTKPTTENPKGNIITTTHKELETKNSHLDDEFRDSTVSPMERAEPTTIKECHESTTVIAFYNTNIFYTNVPIPQKEGFRIPLIILIAIIICVLSIIAVVIVLVIKHRKTKGYKYELSTMNQLSALEGAGHRCQANTDETRVTNTYEPCNPPPVLEYEGILATFSNEYESLVVERSPDNNCS
ncbi:V-set and immunoglobulin domain-containing protein 4 isoform X8 [Hyla sarda]|uniref:V-set and immunoglobulin domain-containing protein 4 isoform X8 n=1 Tax=Hyla sarda TaxID=327740 RepID=UPI0024C3162E|nr:V-set and immunoglobulin domain-containing protein 4 isoform X8 [Hyla sarda]